MNSCTNGRSIVKMPALPTPTNTRKNTRNSQPGIRALGSGVNTMTPVTISLATGVMVFTPEPSALIPGWLFLVFFRVFVGVGNAGIFTIDLPLVQEFIPAYKRGWVSALVTTLLPGGGMLAGLVASWLLPIIGWRYLFLGGLSPLLLVFMIRYWVPESPRWLMRMGRMEEARKSLAWALMIDPREIALPAMVPATEQTRWLDLF